MKTYNKCVKQGNNDSINEVFDIIKKDGDGSVVRTKGCIIFR